MKFKRRARVRVKDGNTFWFGQIVTVGEASYEIRIGGTDRVVSVEQDRVLKQNPDAMEALDTAFAAHRLVVLGCPSHGLDCAETLVRFCREKKVRVGTVFLEGYPYVERVGVDRNAPMTHGQQKILEGLDSICDDVVGLETRDTVPDPKCSLPDKEKFGREKRSTMANNHWAKLIIEHKSNKIDVVCVGAAHLVTVSESNKDVDALQVQLAPLNLRIPTYAVANDTNGMYKPEDSKSGYVLAFRALEMDPDDDFDIDEGD